MRQFCELVKCDAFGNSCLIYDAETLNPGAFNNDVYEGFFTNYSSLHLQNKIKGWLAKVFAVIFVVTDVLFSSFLLLMIANNVYGHKISEAV